MTLTNTETAEYPEDIRLAAEEIVIHFIRDVTDRQFIVKVIAAALNSERQRSQWQDIGTAPENTAILIHIPHLDYYGNKGVYAGMLVNMGTGRRWMTFGCAIGRDLGRDDAPKSWRPIPAAPVEGA